MLSDGTVRCWGLNQFGQLGQEHISDVPLAHHGLLPVSLGEGMLAMRVEVGIYHACAILQDGTLKCWGRGSLGQPGPRADVGVKLVSFAVDTCHWADELTSCYARLGQGSSENIGDGPSEMGDHLPPIDLANLAVRQVSLGISHTCALLEDDSVRCWGDNTAGQLGIGSTTSIGTRQSEMGEALPPTDLFVVTPGEEMQGLRLIGAESSGMLQIQYNGSFGLVCDDLWSETAAQVACRELGLAGGRAFSAAQQDIYNNLKTPSKRKRIRFDCRWMRAMAPFWRTTWSAKAPNLASRTVAFAAGVCMTALRERRQARDHFPKACVSSPS